ncbi:MAG: hypothetical protein ACM3MK_11580 [Chitinophagales bacterium]
MRHYWQLDLYTGDSHKTRYLYGTEAAANSRTRRYTADKKELKQLDRPLGIHLKTVKKIRFIDL